ncbi:VOC family protein [Luteibacter aegosomatissinici]|uniref:VOC family protein n=1 Tax=Luteibacter aegosomatissinici TaxID=2911539 RepID=UPI001FFACF04|nr:VOC family protein [Luteibacter aegosomatissinici]UPG94969.1 VOC family protein [Luteibacter aegosomatissinici]
MPSLGALTFLVHDYDEAIAFFTKALRFDLVEDTPQGNDKRWVTVAPRGSQGTRLLLARAINDEQRAHVGKQGGGRVFLFLETDDFAGDHAHMLAHGVRFREEPRHEVYGSVVVFEDLYGNGWDLIQPKRQRA